MKNGERIYLDNAATTFPKPEHVYQEMDRVNRTLAVNAGRGSYFLARQAQEIIEQTREYLLGLVCANQVAEVVLSVSATIALNQIIGGIQWKKCDTVYVSPYEHNAVMRALHVQQKRYCFQILELPLQKENLQIDLKKTEFLFAQNPPSHLFVTHMSNVTGYILPLERLARLGKEYQALVVVDASQSLGLLPVDLRLLPVDILVFAGHKNLYGPLGTGGFYIRRGIILDTYLAGGTGSDSLNLKMPEHAPERYEPASPNIAATAGLCAALEELTYTGGPEDHFRTEQELTGQLRTGLQRLSGVTVYGHSSETSVGIVSFNIRGYKALEIGTILDEDYGIAVRTGYHCAPLIHKFLEDQEYGGTVRAGIGRYTTEEEIDKLIMAVSELAG